MSILIGSCRRRKVEKKKNVTAAVPLETFDYAQAGTRFHADQEEGVMLPSFPVGGGKSELGNAPSSNLCAFALQSWKNMVAKICIALSAYELHTRICEYVVHLDINV